MRNEQVLDDDQRGSVFFRILGPLEVTIGGRTVRVGRNRQMTILAVLLINANRMVPVRRLISAVWGVAPPTTADKQIQTCVWRLRRSFESMGAPPNLIETVQGGYLLRLTNACLDSQIFEKTVRQAAFHAEQGDRTKAINEYYSALAMFRGAPLSEIASPTLQVAAAHWEERRLAVLEKRLELELAAGRHAELVSELKVLVAEHPLREQLRAQLMTALYLSHRRADALAVYRAGRAALVDNLGIEPSSRLQDLHRRIIAGEPISLPAHTQPRRVAEVPAQIPADLGDFTGRCEELKQLEHDLADLGGQRIIAVVGRGGVGKTALAVHLAHRVRDRFPDGQLHVNLRASTRRSVPVVEALRGFLHALGVPDHRIPTDMAGCAALFRSLTTGRRLLVVLDDAAPAQIEPLLPGGGGSAVLCTSRTSMAEVPGARVHRIEGLPTRDGTRLLAQVVGVDRVSREVESAQQIVALCGHLPLAIRAAGARLNARPRYRLDRFLDCLADEERRLNELSYGSLDVIASFEATADRLPAEARRAWMLLGIPELAHIPTWAAAVLLDQQVRETQYLLDCLVDNQALDCSGEDVLCGNRYVFHPLIRIYTRRRAAQELDERTRWEVQHRLTEAYRWLEAYASSLARNRRGGPVVIPTAEPHAVERIAWPVLREMAEHVQAWLSQERPNLLAIAESGGTRRRQPDPYGWHASQERLTGHGACSA
jgi:DNA-binding SARP family transcriptional activator